MGNLLGAGEPKKARETAWLSLFLSVVALLVLGVIEIAARSVLGSIFTNDPEVVQAVDNCILLVVVMQFFDATQGVLSGILRGVGLQTIGAVGNLLAYYAICLPLAYTFAFHTSLGFLGIWLGLTCGVFSCTTIFVIVMYRLDWNHQSLLAQARATSEVPGATPVVGATTTAAAPEAPTELALDGVAVYGESHFFETNEPAAPNGKGPSVVSQSRGDKVVTMTAATTLPVVKTTAAPRAASEFTPRFRPVLALLFLFLLLSFLFFLLLLLL